MSIIYKMFFNTLEPEFILYELTDPSLVNHNLTNPNFQKKSIMA